MTFGSLFAGIGGFDLGFERAGMECKWQVEIDDYANDVLAKHWPDVPRWRDIRTFPPRPDSPWLSGSWRDKWYVDVICGGFPCQDISYAGKGAGLAGERSGLFFEAIRVVQQIRPRIVVLENVAALLNGGMDCVLWTLAEIGFDAEWHCLPAASFGATHIRDRLFLVAYPSVQRRPVLVRDRRQHEVFISVDAYEGWPSVASRTRLSIAAWLERQGVDESPLHRVGSGVPARVDRLRGLGNAVVPQVAQWIGERIMEHGVV